MNTLIKYTVFMGAISISGIIISIPILIFEKSFPDCFYTCFLSTVILLFMFENWNLLEDFHKEVEIRGQSESQNKSLLKIISDLNTSNLASVKLKADCEMLIDSNAGLSRQIFKLSGVNDSLKIENHTISLKINKLNFALQKTKLEIIQGSSIDHIKSCSNISDLSF